MREEPCGDLLASLEQKPPHLNFLHCQEEAQHPVKAQVAQSVVMQFMNAFLVHGVEVDQVEPDYYNFCTRPGEGPTACNFRPIMMPWEPMINADPTGQSNNAV
ncbi:hypothetical protein BLA27_18515 [Brucella cytisi]|uniref:Uncharacterized protein n=1 Tax=Brucella cytisi TaxID=407152 RepID=A0A1J6HZP2_9HYPH|nr:hypothetical protein BLA27_18515 [Brucella cytisi]